MVQAPGDGTKRLFGAAPAEAENRTINTHQVHASLMSIPLRLRSKIAFCTPLCVSWGIVLDRTQVIRSAPIESEKLMMNISIFYH